MNSLLDRRLIINMGKGGVGKSLVSAAMARIAMESGKRVLLVQINTKDKISGYLGCPLATSEVIEVLPGLHSVNIYPPAALKEYAMMQVKIELIYRLVFENRAVRYFLRAVPALNDLVTLGKINYHFLQTEAKNGKPLFDQIIVDAPPTGHGIFLLNLPNVMLRAVNTGPVKREANIMLDMLQNPATTAINLVTIPEEMPIAETVEMYENIKQELEMPLGWVFVNQVFPEHFNARDQTFLKQMAARTNGDLDLIHLAEVAQSALARRNLSLHYLEELERRVPLDTIQLPLIHSENFGPEQCRIITERISEGARNGP